MPRQPQQRCFVNSRQREGDRRKAISEIWELRFVVLYVLLTIWVLLLMFKSDIEVWFHDKLDF